MSTDHNKIINEYIEKNTLSEQVARLRGGRVSQKKQAKFRDTRLTGSSRDREKYNFEFGEIEVGMQDKIPRLGQEVALLLPVISKVQERKPKRVGTIAITYVRRIAYMSYSVGPSNTNFKWRLVKREHLRAFRQSGAKAKKLKVDRIRAHLKSLFADAEKKGIIDKFSLRVLNKDLEYSEGLENPAYLSSASVGPGATPFFLAGPKLFWGITSKDPKKKEKATAKVRDYAKINKSNTYKQNQIKARKKPEAEKEGDKGKSQPRVKKGDVGQVLSFTDKKELTTYKTRQDRLLIKVSRRLNKTKDLLNVDKVADILIGGKIKNVKERAGETENLRVFPQNMPDREKYFIFKRMVEEFQRFLIRKGFLPKRSSTGKDNIDGLFGRDSVRGLNDLMRMNNDQKSRFSAKDWVNNELKSLGNISKVLETTQPYKYDDYTERAGIEPNTVLAKVLNSPYGTSNIYKIDAPAIKAIQAKEKYTVRKEDGTLVFKDDIDWDDFEADILEEFQKAAKAAPKERKVEEEQLEAYIETRTTEIYAAVQRRKAEEKEASAKARDAKPLNQLQAYISLFLRPNTAYKNVITDMIKQLMPNLNQELEKMVTEDNLLALFDAYIKITGKGYSQSDHPLLDRYQNRPPQKDDKSEVESIREFFNSKEETEEFLNFLSKPRVLMKYANFNFFDAIVKKGVTKGNSDATKNMNYSKFLYDMRTNQKEVYGPHYTQLQAAFNLYANLAPAEKKTANYRMAAALIRFIGRNNVVDFKSILEKAKDVFSKIDGDFLDKVLRDNRIKLASIPLGTWISKLVRRGHLIPNPKTGQYEWSPELQDPEARSKMGYASGSLQENNNIFSKNSIILEIKRVIDSVFIGRNLKIEFSNHNITENSQFLNYFAENKDPLEDLVRVFDINKIIKDEIFDLVDVSEHRRAFHNLYPESSAEFDKHSREIVKNKLTFIKENSNIICKKLYNTIMETSLEKINDFLVERAA